MAYGPQNTRSCTYRQLKILFRGMEISIKKGDILTHEAQMIAVGVYEQTKWEDVFIERINELLDGKFRKLAKIQQFEGKLGQSMIFPAPKSVNAEYFLVLGLGPFDKLENDHVREATGHAIASAKKLGVTDLAIELLGEDEGITSFDARKNAESMTIAALLADYEFTAYKKSQAKAMSSMTIIAEDGKDVRKATAGVERGKIIADGVSVARDLVNTPGQDMNPDRLAEVAKQLTTMSDGMLTLTVLDRKACEKRKMGAYLAVAQGSEDEPRFIHLTYKPKKQAKKKIAFVGKGVTFDSGGLSLKPSDAMMTMKCDMAGGAAVLGIFATLARLQPSVEIHGIIAATDNMPSAKAIRPGDVVRASNGKTIEVLNTDAEGRLTLADALHYACELKPDVVIDFATLTGACVVGLGEEIAALMTPDEELGNKILQAADGAGEKLWRMPLEARYAQLLKSDIADLRNIARSRYGGSLTAGLFLSEFISNDVEWAHLDIAGPAYAERPLASYLQKGGSGYAVRTMLDLLLDV